MSSSADNDEAQGQEEGTRSRNRGASSSRRGQFNQNDLRAVQNLCTLRRGGNRSGRSLPGTPPNSRSETPPPQTPPSIILPPQTLPSIVSDPSPQILYPFQDQIPDNDSATTLTDPMAVDPPVEVEIRDCIQWTTPGPLPIEPSAEEVPQRQKTVREYICDICGKRFGRSFGVRMHLRSHTGEKPFECEKCLKRFAHRSHLTRHHRVHTGEQPFGCGICKKRFTEKGSLKRHMRRAHPPGHAWARTHRTRSPSI